MSPAIIGIIGIVALLIMIYSRMWIGCVMLFIGFMGIVAISGWHQALIILGTVPYRTIADYTFAAMALFLLMGMVVYNAGFGTDLFNSGYKWLGQLRGGLAMATSIACAILGVVTDSVVAVITLGKVAVPEMRKYNYDDSLATASIVAGASLASLVPPSIGFIVYAILTGTSVGKLYMAAVIPAIVLTVLIILTIYIRVRITPRLAMPGPKTSFKEKIVSLKYTWAMALLFALILGGIYFGVFTPTEAGAIGAFGAIVIGLFSRRLNWQKLLDSFLETGQMVGMIVLLVGSAFVFVKLMALSQLPFVLADFITGLDVSKYVVITLIVLVYILFGMFSDIMVAILITVPILFPTIEALGFDPIWFGVLTVIVSEMGFITPPIGLNIFVLSGISNVPIQTIFRGVWPFVIALLVFIVIITAFPQIVTFIPNTM